MANAGWGVEGDTKLEEAKLRAFAAVMVDLRPFWPKVIPLFIGWMREQFETEGLFWGTPWQPLSPGYAAFKARRFPGKGILVAEGDLRRGASLPQRQVTPRTLTLTIDWPKGGLEEESGLRWDPAWHHLGRGNLPARPLVADGLPPTAMLELESAVADYVDDTARRLGL